MTEFQNKKFNVYPGKDGGKTYRDNWDAIFGKKNKRLSNEEEEADAMKRWEEQKTKPEPPKGPEPVYACACMGECSCD